MEKFYVISYDLKNPGRDYTALYSAIKSKPHWNHPLESMWIVRTYENANTLYNSLCGAIDKNDLLFVSELNVSNVEGWMPQSFWQWMTNLKNI